MGIFDKLTGSKDIRLTAKGALALAAITMIAIDGSIEDEEIGTLRRIIKGDDNAFEQAYNVYKDNPVSECVQIVSRTLDQKQKLATTAVLLDIAMADGMLAGSEKELMLSYAGAFQVTEETVKDIVSVIALKNDISIFG